MYISIKLKLLSLFFAYNNIFNVIINKYSLRLNFLFSNNFMRPFHKYVLDD